MRRLLGPLVALLLSAAFVASPTSGVALAAEAGSYLFSVNPTGTINVHTREITLTGTYSCTIPRGAVQADSETQIDLHGRSGYEALLYTNTDTVVCDGRTRKWSTSDFASPRGVPGKASYDAAGYQAWTDADGNNYNQADFHVSGTVFLRPTH
jgi:hypothetical protein